MMAENGASTAERCEQLLVRGVGAVTNEVDRTLRFWLDSEEMPGSRKCEEQPPTAFVGVDPELEFA